jgi:hypothetical protein
MFDDFNYVVLPFVFFAGQYCEVSDSVIHWSFIMYFSYFLLFFHFFYIAYLAPKSKQQSKPAFKSSNDQVKLTSNLKQELPNGHNHNHLNGYLIQSQFEKDNSKKVS